MKYTEPGEYELTYTATDDCGNVTEETRQITVVDPWEEINLTPPHTATLVRDTDGYNFELSSPTTFNNGDILYVEINGVKSESFTIQEESGVMNGECTLCGFALLGEQGTEISAGELLYKQSTGAETIDFRLFRKG